MEMQSNQIEYSRLMSEYFRYRNDWSRVTTMRATDCMNCFVLWIGPRELTAANLAMFAADITKRYAPSYVGLILKHVSWFLGWMSKVGYLKADPSIGIKKPKVYSKDPKPGYTPEEYVALRDYFASRPSIRTFIIIAYHTGMAMVDCCKLTWGEVDLDKMLIKRVRQKMSKRTGSTSTIPIVSGSDLDIELRRLASIHRTDDNAFVDPGLFSFHMGGNANGHKCGTTLKITIRNASIKLGIPIKGTHGFRRGLLSALANDPDLNPFHATAVSGHRSVNMLKRYVTTDPEQLKISVDPILRRLFDKHSVSVDSGGVV